MSSIRQQVVDAIVVALNDARPSNIPLVVLKPPDEIRLDATTPRHLDVVFDQDTEDQDGDEGPVAMHDMVVALRGLTINGATTTPEQEADGLYVWIVKKLTNNRLGGLAQKMLVRQSNQKRSALDQRYCELITAVQVKFRSKSTDAELRF